MGHNVSMYINLQTDPLTGEVIGKELITIREENVNWILHSTN